MRIAFASLLLIGCLHHDPSDGWVAGDDTSSPTTPPEPTASGTYKVRTEIDVTVAAVLPEPAYDMVVTLRDFSQNPARTMFDVAEAAGVPAVGTIRDALPSALESRLEGWINDEIAKLKINNVPVTQLAANIAALAETSLTTFAIDSELSITGATATHSLVTLDLAPTGLDVQFALDALPTNVVSATTACTVHAGTISLGDHGYSLAYGAYLWTALDHTLAAQYGGNIRATLGTAVNCPALANRIATKCILGLCVGHAADLTSICESGLDEIVDRVHDKIAALKIDALHLAAGHAQLVDADHDGKAERLANGLWTAELNAGQGLRPVPATFTASK